MVFVLRYDYLYSYIVSIKACIELNLHLIQLVGLQFLVVNVVVGSFKVKTCSITILFVADVSIFILLKSKTRYIKFFLHSSVNLKGRIGRLMRPFYYFLQKSNFLYWMIFFSSFQQILFSIPSFLNIIFFFNCENPAFFLPDSKYSS